MEKIPEPSINQKNPPLKGADQITKAEMEEAWLPRPLRTTRQAHACYFFLPPDFDFEELLLVLDFEDDLVEDDFELFGVDCFAFLLLDFCCLASELFEELFSRLVTLPLEDFAFGLAWPVVRRRKEELPDLESLDDFRRLLEPDLLDSRLESLEPDLL